MLALRTIIILLLALLLSACSFTTQAIVGPILSSVLESYQEQRSEKAARRALGFHTILGSDHGWSVYDFNIIVLLDASIGDLRVRHVKMKNQNCMDGHSEHLELQGIIGDDSTAAIGLLLPQLHQCFNANGSRIANIVYLDSRGGLLKDGYKLGELFKEHQVVTIIPNNVLCASSCAIAFLGGNMRYMYGNARLMFHAPYRSSGSVINCSNRDEVEELRIYFRSFLGQERGDFLFERTMDHCSAASGWTLNADAARLFNLTTP